MKKKASSLGNLVIFLFFLQVSIHTATGNLFFKTVLDSKNANEPKLSTTSCNA